MRDNLSNMQTPLFKPQTEWVPPQTFPNLKESKMITVDIETCDEELKVKGPGWPTGKGFITGVAVKADDFAGYFPVAHQGGGNLDKKKVFSWLKDVLALPCPKLFHNATYDVGWLEASGFKVNGRINDTMLAAALIDENRFSYTLNALSKDYLNEYKSETLLRDAAKDWNIDPKKEMWKLPSGFVGEYAEQDVILTSKLWDLFNVEIDRQSLSDVYNLELDLLPLLLEMTRRGVRVDIEKAGVLEKEFINKEKVLLHDIKKETGIDVEIWAAASVAKAFDKLKIDYPRTPKSKQPSFTKNFLANHENPLAQKIVKAREINKARTTFIETIYKHSHKGRIHAHIHQMRSDDGGTVTGRFSYSNPNLQQIPARNKNLGPRIRSIFIPEKDHKWGAFDFSQQEPRLVAHYARLTDQFKSEEIIEAYEDPRTDFHQLVADMAGIPRKQAKTINLGLFYGMGKNKLSAELGITKPEAEDLFNKYHTRVPFVKSLATAVTKRASDKGKIRTLKGRVCRFDLWEPNEFGIHRPLPYNEALSEWAGGENGVYYHRIRRAFTYKALNRLIQGSAADQTKQVMVDLYKEGIVPHIQIHDELDISIKNEKEVDKIIEIMQNSIKLEVPTLVDVEIGPSWGETYERKK